MNKQMLDAIVAGVVEKIAGDITAAITADDTMSRVLADVHAAAPLASTRKTGARHTRRVRKQTGRTHYRAVKPGKAGASVSRDLADRLVPAYDAIRAAGAAGAHIVALETATGRTTKQLENDIMALRSMGHVVSDND